MFGKSVWEEALHDMTMENIFEVLLGVIEKIYP